MIMRNNRAAAALLSVVLAAALATGCAPTKEGIKNRQAASDRMNLVGAQVNYEQSRQLFASGQLDKSLREIDKAIARYPKSGAFHLMRGRILLEQARLEQALASFTLALENDSKLADAHYYAGVVYQRWSDEEQAFTCYVAAHELETDKVHYLLAAAEALTAMGEFERAQTLIEPRLAYFEHNASLRQLLAQIAMLRGNAAQSADLYAQARLLNPDDVTLLEEMMWAQYAAGQYAKCLESAKLLEVSAGANRQAGASSSQRSSSEPRSDIVHLKARCLGMMGRGVEARELYLELVKMRTADTTVWSELGALAWELGDYRTVAQASVQLMSMSPERHEGYLFRGVNERQKGNLQEAVRLFRESCRRVAAARSDPDSGRTLTAVPFVVLGQTLEQMQDWAGARDAYNDALKADPGSEEAKTLLRRLNGEQRVTSVPMEG